MAENTKETRSGWLLHIASSACSGRGTIGWVHVYTHLWLIEKLSRSIIIYICCVAIKKISVHCNKPTWHTIVTQRGYKIRGFG